MDRAAKEAFVTSFSEKLERARIAIVTDFRGLDVNTTVDFRKSLSENTEFRVVKNSLARRALKGTAYEGLIEHFVGTNAVVLGYDDVVESTKAATEFAEDNEQLAFKAGVLDGRVLGVDELKALAELPSKDVLQAMLLGVREGPSRNLVSLLANCNRQLVNVLTAYQQKLEEEGN